MLTLLMCSYYRFVFLAFAIGKGSYELLNVLKLLSNCANLNAYGSPAFRFCGDLERSGKFSEENLLGLMGFL
jgi:hypothetical protein